MLSIEECKRYLGEDLTDKEIEELRALLYGLVENLIDRFLKRPII